MISNPTIAAIDALDLTPIKLKLTHKKFGEGWSQYKADAMETEYRRFLYLQMAFPNEQTAPTLDVDTFWHYHILDTMKYSADCEKVFGYFLHHYPYLGLMEGDEPDLEIEAGNRTRELYEATFGEAYIRAEAYGDNETGDADGHHIGAGAVKGSALGRVDAKCQGACIVATPAYKGYTSAKCQGACIVAKPAAKGHASPRCQGACIVAELAVKRQASARGNFDYFVDRQAFKELEAAKCQGMCIGGKAATLASDNPLLHARTVATASASEAMN